MISPPLDKQKRLQFFLREITIPCPADNHARFSTTSPHPCASRGKPASLANPFSPIPAPSAPIPSSPHLTPINPHPSRTALWEPCNPHYRIPPSPPLFPLALNSTATFWKTRTYRNPAPHAVLPHISTFPTTTTATAALSLLFFLLFSHPWLTPTSAHTTPSSKPWSLPRKPIYKKPGKSPIHPRFPRFALLQLLYNRSRPKPRKSRIHPSDLQWFRPDP